MKDAQKLARFSKHGAVWLAIMMVICGVKAATTPGWEPFFWFFAALLCLFWIVVALAVRLFSSGAIVPGWILLAIAGIGVHFFMTEEILRYALVAFGVGGAVLSALSCTVATCIKNRAARQREG